MNDKTTWLANFFERLGITFERFNPALFRFLAAVLPYTTPYPVAWKTMRSTEKFLGFSPEVAFVFVFGLEGIGLWFTSLLVDSVIDWILSKNWKTFFLVILFSLVVSAYVVMLVNLNVTLEKSAGNNDPVMARVITILCFLPLLTGIGNGYYKWKIEQAQKMDRRDSENKELAERIRQENRQDRRERTLIKAGINPQIPQVQYQSQTQSPREQTRDMSDWRNLSEKQKYEVSHILSVREIMQKYPVSKSTAYEWKKKNV